jgi:(p)ppGpp synthase/HD superfamily hydrolase
MDMPTQKKQEANLRHMLQIKDYHSALRALELAMVIHNGWRKDGTTREVNHQIEMALHAMILPGIRDLELLVIVILLHDTVEDYGLRLEVIAKLFGDRVAASVDCLTKVIPIFEGGETVDISYLAMDGSKIEIVLRAKKIGKSPRDEAAMFVRMGFDVMASLVKGIDRANNQRTMAGVFSAGKQVEYVQYTDDHILPMMKLARRRFPDQQPAYELLKHLLTTQARLVRGWAEMTKSAA